MSFDVIRLKETESTNTYAKALLKNGEPSAPYTLIYAENQTAGRGRLGRTWESRKGDSLCMSLIAPFPHNPSVTLLAALGVYRALDSLIDAQINIKWPNDLICENKKLCGILTESTNSYAVIGIGINLNSTEFSAEIAHKATSLKLLTGNAFPPFETAKLVAASMRELLEESKGALTPQLHKEYTNLCANIGKEITFGNKIGTATGIAGDGALIVLTPDGTEHINSGEVTLSGIY